MVFCSNCGTQVIGKFCPSCGSPAGTSRSTSSGGVGGVGNNIDRCPGCRQIMSHSNDSSDGREKVIVSGNSWHKDCYHIAHPSKEPARGFRENISSCPGCGAQMVTGQNTGDKTIVRGQEWHKSCYERAHPSKEPKRGLQEDVNYCPGCRGRMVTGQDTGSKTIIGGQEWHKSCYEQRHPTRGLLSYKCSITRRV